MTPAERDLVHNFLQSYCSRWQAHGHPLRSSFDLRFDQFIVIAADESFNGTSGCSVDDSVRAIKEIERLTSLSFFDRTLVAFLINGQVTLLKLRELKQKSADGIWNEQTLAFNNLISVKSLLDDQWIVPASNTWLKRYVVAEPMKN
jgi:hypothetical protein